MAIPTTSQRPSPSPAPSRGRGRTAATTLLLVVVGLLVIAAGSLIGMRLARAGVLPGVTVGGVDVGGSSTEQLRSRVESLARNKAGIEVAAVRDDQRVAGQAGELGYALDVDATVAAVLHRGRQGNPISALSDHLRSFGGTIEVAPVEDVDDAPLDQWAQAAAEELELEPVEADLTFIGDQITRVEPEDGALVDADELASQMRERLLDGAGGDVEVATEPIEPVTTTADLDDAERRGQTLVSAPITFTRSGSSVKLSPEQIGTVLTTRVTDGDPAIRIRALPAALRAVIGETTIAAFEVEPESASFEVVGGEVRLKEGQEGFRYSPKKAARQLVEVGMGERPRRAELRGKIAKPELTTEEAEELEITEQVSSFTTEHACCESRVTNIHRIADIVDGVVIEPGDTFSVNGFVGERTEEKGFVNGGAIFEGEFVEQIGGGVSQFATTLYNAAYFGGYEITEHKAHSYYISRYPVGREATLNYPNVDLKITNDSPYGMLLSTSYTDTSITVSVYGTKWVEVDTVAGERHNFRPAQTQYRENDDLPKGEERVIQEAGADGFDITVTRILTYPDGTTEREPVTTTYLPQVRIVERNT